jgi:peptidylprolyl isomerase
MATTKRQRQKEARREKMEALQRQNKRRQNLRRGVIALVVAIVVIGSAALFFQKSNPATVTIPTSSTTTTVAKCVPSGIDLKPTKVFAAVTSPQAAGTFGKAPTVVVPTTPAPKVMQVSDLIKGTGPAVKVCDYLTMQYVLADYATHKVLQSSWTSSSFGFTIGEQQVIPGWDEGILGMKAGGRREMVVTPALAYGSNPPSGIAKNDTLIFVVDLLKVTAPAA